MEHGTAGRQATCRVCSAPFFRSPLLELENMPRAAQNFPDKSGLGADLGEDLELCQCSGCGLVQLSNTPVDYFRDVIRATAFSREMQEFRREQFRDFIDRFQLTGRKVIEIGCGRGEFLSLMQDAGAEAYGLEHLQASVDDCHNQGLNVIQGYLDAPGYSIDSAPFDAFFILNFFEHLPDPNTALGAMAGNLTDEGIGLIEVPSFDMILEKNLFSEFINDHLFYFTSETLTSTLNYNGFEIVEIQSVWHDYILSALVKKRQSTDLTNLTVHQEKISKEINQYLDNRHGKKAAVWGAGHQALAVLSLANLASRIDVVLDSAPFKQNRYTPATHIPIVSPDELDKGELEVVIIMAASYSDEVLRTINEKYGTSLDVAVLRDFGLESISD